MHNLDKWNRIVQSKTNGRLKVVDISRNRKDTHTRTVLKVCCKQHPNNFSYLVTNSLRNKSVIKCDECLSKLLKKKGLSLTKTAIDKQIKLHSDRIDFSYLHKNELKRSTYYTVKCIKRNLKYKTTFELLQKGHGNCPICKNIARSKSKLLPNEIYIKRLKEMYGDKYDLSKVNYDGKLFKTALELGNFLNVDSKCDLRKLLKYKTINLYKFDK